jgi:hypothetical protein
MKLFLGVGPSTSYRLATPQAKVSPNRVPRDRSQPRSKTVARPIAAEAADVLRDGDKNLLDEIRGIVS